MQTSVIPTGNIALDVALGIGGLPRGVVVDVRGDTGSVVLACAAETQKIGGTVAYLAWPALDVSRAQKHGANVDELLVCEPDCLDQALEIAETFARSGAVDLVVVDGVGALASREPDDGRRARLMSQALRKLTATIHRTQATVLFTTEGTTACGTALKFYSSVRLHVRLTTNAYNARAMVKVVKNKFAAPFAEAEFLIHS